MALMVNPEEDGGLAYTGNEQDCAEEGSVRNASESVPGGTRSAT